MRDRSANRKQPTRGTERRRRAPANLRMSEPGREGWFSGGGTSHRNREVDGAPDGDGPLARGGVYGSEKSAILL